MMLAALPSYSCISGLIPEYLVEFIDEATIDIRPVKCKGIYHGEECCKIVGTISVPAFGMACFPCKKCGHITVVVNGFPLK